MIVVVVLPVAPVTVVLLVLPPVEPRINIPELIARCVCPTGATDQFDLQRLAETPLRRLARAPPAAPPLPHPRAVSATATRQALAGLKTKR